MQLSQWIASIANPFQIHNPGLVMSVKLSCLVGDSFSYMRLLWQLDTHTTFKYFYEYVPFLSCNANLCFHNTTKFVYSFQCYVLYSHWVQKKHISLKTANLPPKLGLIYPMLPIEWMRPLFAEGQEQCFKSENHLSPIWHACTPLFKITQNWKIQENSLS